MGNRLNVKSGKVEFTNEGESCPCVMVFDDYSSAFTYGNAFIPDFEDDLAALRWVKEQGFTDFDNVLEWHTENKLGMYINETWYEWDEVKDILVESDEEE